MNSNHPVKCTLKVFKKSLGFSMLEVIISLGLFSLVSLGIGQMLLGMDKSQNFIRKKTNLGAVQSDLTGLFKAQDHSCGCTFNNDLLQQNTTNLKNTIVSQAQTNANNVEINLNLNEVNVAAFTSGGCTNMKSIVQNGNLLNYSDLQITSWKIKSPVNQGSNKFLFDMEISIQPKNNLGTVKPITIPNILIDVTSGQVQCIKTNDQLAGMNCNGQAISGFDSSGNPICTPMIDVNTCDANNNGKTRFNPATQKIEYCGGNPLVWQQAPSSGGFGNCQVCYQCAAKCSDPAGMCNNAWGTAVCVTANSGWSGFGGFPSPTNQADDQPSLCRIQVNCP